VEGSCPTQTTKFFSGANVGVDVIRTAASSLISVVSFCRSSPEGLHETNVIINTNKIGSMDKFFSRIESPFLHCSKLYPTSNIIIYVQLITLEAAMKKKRLWEYFIQSLHNNIFFFSY
jgi:hypothetical protein